MHTHSASFVSPLQSRKLQGNLPSETVIVLIPALNVQVHYKSLVGQSYQFPSPTTSLHESGSDLQHEVPRVEITPGTPDAAAPPRKRGVLAVSVVVKSTPEDMTLTPSLLEFVEQVVRPTMAATTSSKADNSNDVDSGDEGGGEEESIPGRAEVPPISFPVDVTVVLHMQPSRVTLSCQPHSRVHCVVCSPSVSFVVSFSLMSTKEVDGADSGNSVVSFKNLYVTGCLKTFTLQVLSPQVSSFKHSESESVKTVEKEALSLTLGLALIHLSRKLALTETRQSPPGDNSSCSCSKLQVSGEPHSVVYV